MVYNEKHSYNLFRCYLCFKNKIQKIYFVKNMLNGDKIFKNHKHLGSTTNSCGQHTCKVEKEMSCDKKLAPKVKGVNRM